MTSHTPVIVFPDQSLSFANGLEVGALSERLKTNQKDFSQTISASNESIVQMLAAHYGWKITIVARKPAYLTLQFTCTNSDEETPHGV